MCSFNMVTALPGNNIKRYVIKHSQKKYITYKVIDPNIRAIKDTSFLPDNC